MQCDFETQMKNNFARTSQHFEHIEHLLISKKRPSKIFNIVSEENIMCHHHPHSSADANVR